MALPPGAYICAAVRTPVGKRGGALAGMHPADLGALCVNAILDKVGFDGAAVDDVIFGCVSQIGAQSANLGRNVVLASRLPESVPGCTVDRQCGSGQQAIHFAAQAVLSGTADIVIAGGAEVMSLVPIGASVTDGMDAGRGGPFDAEGITARYPGVAFSQFEGAEILADKLGVTRAECDAAAAASHTRAAAAQAAGHFAAEIVEVPGKLAKDEGVRVPVDVKKLATLRTLKEGGKITAASSSQISDGAAAVLVCSAAGAAKLKVTPLARIVSMALAGDDPIMMLGGPIPASRRALAQVGLTIKDIDLYEVNEAFASVPLAWAKALGADLARLNASGGAMALGHPLGATGAKLMATLVHALIRTGGRRGLLAICEGGGTANATIIERFDPAAAAAAPRARM